MTTDEPILREILSDLAVAVITLNRPQTLNALSDAVMGALDDELTSLESDDAVRCVVLRGSGRAFAAGADVSAMAEEGAAELLAGGQLDRWERVRRFEKPLIAAVHGFCLGGGCELAESCDIVIAADDARFGLPEVSLGIIPGAGGTQLTPRAVGKSLAMEMVLAGRFLSADEALAHGLCSRVVAHEALRDEAVALAAAIASRPPIAVRLAKRAIVEAFETSLAAGVEHERAAFATAFATEDAREGIAGVRREAPAAVEGTLSMADEPELVVERVGAVTTLRLNRPDRSNALTRSARAELARALRDAGRDAEVRCVVLAGAGTQLLRRTGSARGGRPRRRRRRDPRRLRADRPRHRRAAEAGDRGGQRRRRWRRRRARAGLRHPRVRRRRLRHDGVLEHRARPRRRARRGSSPSRSATSGRSRCARPGGVSPRTRP